jgi:lipopolysaccharide biosynthesis protein
VVLGQLRLQIEPCPKRSKMCIVCRWHCWGSKDKDVLGSDLWDRYENLRILINKKLGNISVRAEKRTDRNRARAPCVTAKSA